MPVETYEAFEKLTRGRLVEIYGLTEATAITHANPAYGSGSRIGSTGVPIPNTDARIVDFETGAEPVAGLSGGTGGAGPPSDAGILRAGGARPAAAGGGLAVHRRRRVGDEAGFFHILGRKTDIVRVNGAVVYPRDVEEALYEHSRVQDVAVVGMKAAMANSG